MSVGSDFCPSPNFIIFLRLNCFSIIRPVEQEKEVVGLKKVFVAVIVTLAIVMLAASLTSTAQAKKTIVTWESTGGEGANYLYIAPDVKCPPGPDMDVPEPGGLRIAQGTYREYMFVNPILGPGASSSEAIISITHYSLETTTFPDGSYFPTTGWGHGIYRVHYNITSGPYTGTLEGISVATWSWNLAEHLWVDNWGNTTLHSGTGGLEGIRINQEWYTMGSTVMYGGWLRGEVIFP
jgi:hypothetical protein